MKTNIDFEAIITVVKKGYSDFVVLASKEAGAKGATILFGHGSDNSQDNVFLGRQIEPEKEVVFIVVRKSQKKKIMKAILNSADLKKEGSGICFSLPLTNVVGYVDVLS